MKQHYVTTALYESAGMILCCRCGIIISGQYMSETVGRFELHTKSGVQQ